jgi:hypothetical protein
MRNSVCMRHFALAVIGLALASVPLPAAAHEEHKMECNATTMTAMKADIQAMPEGEARATATKEMQMAEEMMAEHDMEGCMAHMHKAMEAIEE